MKVIIAGSRDITEFWKVVPFIKEGFEQLNIIEAPEIVSGCATGMDTIGEHLAEFCGYDLKRIPR